MTFAPDELDRMAEVLQARTESFAELVRIARLDPARDLIGADLSNVNFRTDDLTGYAFAHSVLCGAKFSAARGLEPSMFIGAVWDDSTSWPPGFDPAASGPDVSWADDSGTDRYGTWASFSVTGADGTRVEQRLRWCPPGRFMMGSPEDEEGRFEVEGPRHEVLFARGFWMFETSCRQELWQAVMGGNPSMQQGFMLPVTRVSWQDARRFVERLNAAKPGLGIDLPSEAQWEYACRAGTATAYSFGPTISRQQVNFEGNGPVPVGSLPPNGWGLHEMHGNVCEWCADNWHDNYNAAPADGSAWIDGGAANRVIRGGSWGDDARGVRAAFRNSGHPVYRFGSLGFRCARVQSESEAERRAGRSKRSERSEQAATTGPQRRWLTRLRDWLS